MKTTKLKLITYKFFYIFAKYQLEHFLSIYLYYIR